jgi:hypothetical protein
LNKKNLNEFEETRTIENLIQSNNFKIDELKKEAETINNCKSAHFSSNPRLVELVELQKTLYEFGLLYKLEATENLIKSELSKKFGYDKKRTILPFEIQSPHEHYNGKIIMDDSFFNREAENRKAGIRSLLGDNELLIAKYVELNKATVF